MGRGTCSRVLVCSCVRVQRLRENVFLNESAVGKPQSDQVSAHVPRGGSVGVGWVFHRPGAILEAEYIVNGELLDGLAHVQEFVCGRFSLHARDAGEGVLPYPSGRHTPGRFARQCQGRSGGPERHVKNDHMKRSWVPWRHRAERRNRY